MPQTRIRPHGADIRSRSKPKPQGKTIDKGPSLNALKKRKRNLRRLLEHAEKLPADIRINHERELASCTAGIEDAQNQAELSRMIKKYHMVRFFGEHNQLLLHLALGVSTKSLIAYLLQNGAKQNDT